MRKERREGKRRERKVKKRKEEERHAGKIMEGTKELKKKKG